MKNIKLITFITLFLIASTSNASGSKKIPPAQEMEQSVIVMMLNWLNLS